MKIRIQDGDSEITITGDEVMIYGPNNGTKPIALVKEVNGDWLVSTARDEKFNEFIQLAGETRYGIQKIDVDAGITDGLEDLNNINGVSYA